MSLTKGCNPRKQKKVQTRNGVSASGVRMFSVKPRRDPK
jgi:hypothetical protein